MKIAIIGTHGIGKTTLTYLIAAEGKKRGLNVASVSEVARSCVFPLNESFDTDGANWIVTSQINRELQAKAEKYDMLVCDRSSYDPICYLMAGNHPHRTYEKLKWYAEEWLKTYNKIIFVHPTDEKIVEDGVRCVDADFQKAVHSNFVAFFHYQKLLKYKDIIEISAIDIFKKDLTNLYQQLFE